MLEEIKTVTYKLVCDRCGGTISRNGVAVHGNIHVTNAEKDHGIGGGIVGDNFSRKPHGPRPILHGVGVSHFHVSCFKIIIDRIGL